MSPLDIFMFDWFGDTALNLALFNLIVVGPAAFAAGRSVARNWRPWVQVVGYAALLSAGLRFLDYALWGGELWSIGGYLLGGRFRPRSACSPSGWCAPGRWCGNIHGSTDARGCWAGRSGTKLKAELHCRGETNEGVIRMKKIYGALAVAAVALMATPSFAQIKIGVAGPMTGQNATFGEQLSRGATMAVEDINAAGGVNGKKLELVIGDDACDPKQATAVANKMVSDKVVFVAGHYCSGSSIPASDIYKEGKILQITPASTNIKLTDDAAAKGNTTVFAPAAGTMCRATRSATTS